MINKRFSIYSHQNKKNQTLIKFTYLCISPLFESNLRRKDLRRKDRSHYSHTGINISVLDNSLHKTFWGKCLENIENCSIFCKWYLYSTADCKRGILHALVTDARTTHTRYAMTDRVSFSPHGDLHEKCQ